jgi:hypothetical protein
MDFHALQHKLFEMDPTDPREDLAKLQAQAQGGAVGNVPETKNYVAESVEVPQGSMPLGIDSVSDFAALAGVKVNEAQRTGSAGQAKGKDPMPKAEPGRTKHPLKDKLVGEDSDDADVITMLVRKVRELEERIMKLEGNGLDGPEFMPRKNLVMGEDELDEKAVSKKQQRFMGMVHAAQKGEKAASPEVAKVAKSMKKKDALDFAKTKHKGLPDKKTESLRDMLYAKLAEFDSK